MQNAWREIDALRAEILRELEWHARTAADLGERQSDIRLRLRGLEGRMEVAIMTINRHDRVIDGHEGKIGTLEKSIHLLIFGLAIVGATQAGPLLDLALKQLLGG